MLLNIRRQRVKLTTTMAVKPDRP
uniref:Uncharacterized protein n=1 Tax=Anguilla anguilla TaxID=7936 RepID=A0A0E9T837_ANGAN